MRSYIKLLSSIFLLSICVALSLKTLVLTSNAKQNSEQEALYLPNSTAIKALAFGYKNVLADLILFKTISYFGEHLHSDKNYQWLYHMCDLITELDPRAEDVYRFGSTMLAWESGAIEDSNKILAKAIKRFPSNWIFPYLRGFNYLYFLKDTEKARSDFIEAAKRPGVHPVIAALAAKTTQELDDPAVAEMTIKGLINSTNDPNIIAVLEQKLAELTEKRRDEKK